MGGKSAPAAPAPPKPPEPIPDEKANMGAPGTAPGAIQAAIDEEKKRDQAGMTLGSAAQAQAKRQKKDPASMVQQAPAGGVASSSVLTG